MLFMVSSALKVCYRSNEEFFRHCGGRRAAETSPAAAAAAEALPSWKRVAKGAFMVWFFVVWIAGVSFFWKFNEAFASGSPQPTVAQTSKLTNHGRTVYITAEQNRTVKLLEYSMMIGIPFIFVFGAVLHFVAGVKLFSNGTEDN